MAEIARALIPQVLPNYRVVMERIPTLLEVEQTYLEVKDAATQEVVTDIEVLYPANKIGEGRAKYEAKRQTILAHSPAQFTLDTK